MYTIKEKMENYLNRLLNEKINVVCMFSFAAR